MPWYWQPMKDVYSCDKLGGGAKNPWSQEFRMGKPCKVCTLQSIDEYIVNEKESPWTETS